MSTDVVVAARRVRWRQDEGRNEEPRHERRGGRGHGGCFQRSVCPLPINTAPLKIFTISGTRYYTPLILEIQGIRGEQCFGIRFSVNRKYSIISCICAQKQYVDFRLIRVLPKVAGIRGEQCSYMIIQSFLNLFLQDLFSCICAQKTIWGF